MIIKNRYLTADISALGAELQSLRSADGVEYLWQGDPKYWAGQAPILFPWVGRLLGGQYRCEGKTYELGIHGFARKSTFLCTDQKEDSLTMTLEANPDTLSQYPFDFRFSVIYTLVEDTLQVTFRVENRDEKPMYFAWGGHPGFNVPLVEGETMEDYHLEFSASCSPERVLFSDTNVLVDGFEPYPLEEEKRLQLSHDLFDRDAIFLTHMARETTMRSRKSGRGVTLSYPEMRYLGLWHMPKTDAPYVCIEPWSSLPGREGVTEDISCRSDLLTAAPGEIKQTLWSIRVF